MDNNFYAIYTGGIVTSFNEGKLFVVSQVLNVDTIEVKDLHTKQEWRTMKKNYRPYWLQEGESIYLDKLGVYYIHRIISADSVFAISEASGETKKFSIRYIEYNFKSFED